MSDRIILHVDCNCFYASVEMLYHPELAGKPLAVGGDPQERHGIVLTANYIAKRRGVKTGMALWQARQCCPELVFVPPRMYLYLRFSRMARAIYQEYSEQVESFGLDECWIDLTESCAILGDHTRSLENGYRIAQEISARIRRELGITVSIGVSWNKIYAKLGSDYKKPDAITVFDRDNYQKLIYPLPVSDLLYVGRRTEKKLEKYGIRTIGDLAEADPFWLRSWLGKIGLMLSVFARGEDRTPVNDFGVEAPVRSVGNSTTTPRDLVSDEDVRLVLYLLAESVSERLRENHFEGQVVSIYGQGSFGIPPAEKAGISHQYLGGDRGDGLCDLPAAVPLGKSNSKHRGQRRRFKAGRAAETDLPVFKRTVPGAADAGGPDGNADPQPVRIHCGSAGNYARGPVSGIPECNSGGSHDSSAFLSGIRKSERL